MRSGRGDPAVVEIATPAANTLVANRGKLTPFDVRVLLQMSG
jgi:hypothetical protein